MIFQVLGVEKKKTKDGKWVDRNEPKKTKVVHNNGFNPEWKENFEFKVHLPDLALLEIQGWFLFGYSDVGGRLQFPTH